MSAGKEYVVRDEGQRIQIWINGVQDVNYSQRGV